MKKIKAEKLTTEAFSKFGTFCDFVSPQGSKLSGKYHDYYRDQVLYYSTCDLPLYFSPLVVKSHGFIVDEVEWHNNCCEGIMPITDDIVIHLSPANSEYNIEETQAFIVPAGTLVSIKPGTYHLIPLPLNKESVSCLISLPERTYCNDFCHMFLPEEQQFEIVL